MAISREQLEHYSDQIERVFASSCQPLRILNVEATPRLTKFICHTNINIKSLERSLAIMTGVDTLKIVKLPDDQWEIIMSNPDASSVRLVELLDGISLMPALTTCLGMTEDNRPLTLRLASPLSQHALILGPKDAGKAELLSSMVASLALTNLPKDMRIAIINESLEPLKQFPHNLEPITQPDRSRQLLELLQIEIDQRRLEKTSLKPDIMVVIDNLDSLVRENPSLEEPIVQISRAESLGIHLLASASDLGIINQLLQYGAFPSTTTSLVTQFNQPCGNFSIRYGNNDYPFQAAMIDGVGGNSWPAIQNRLLQPRKSPASWRG